MLALKFCKVTYFLKQTDVSCAYFICCLLLKAYSNTLVCCNDKLLYTTRGCTCLAQPLLCKVV